MSRTGPLSIQVPTVHPAAHETPAVSGAPLQ
jgi:hypothetical protein